MKPSTLVDDVIGRVPQQQPNPIGRAASQDGSFGATAGKFDMNSWQRVHVLEIIWKLERPRSSLSFICFK